MKKWECMICGYIHEGDEPPDECPLCGAGPDQFEEVVEPAAAEEKSAEPVVEPEQPQSESESTQEPAQEVLPETPPSMVEKATQLIMQFHLHPITVHTPNGIIPMAAVFLILAILFGAEGLGNTVLYSLVFVLISMPVVLYTGFVTWKQKYRGAMTSVFKLKIACSIAVTVLLFILVVWGLISPLNLSDPSGGDYFYLLIMIAILACAGTAGHMGGKLIFGKNHK